MPSLTACRRRRVSHEIPVWISVSLRRSEDGRRAVNYAQAKDDDAARGIIERFREHGFLTIGAWAKHTLGLYEVLFPLER